MKPSRKALIIAYHFPPAGGGGVQRTLKFVKYLRCFGWEPVVLTVQNPDFDHFDQELVDDIPCDIQVYKTSEINFWRYYRIKKYGSASVYEVNTINKNKKKC